MSTDPYLHAACATVDGTSRIFSGVHEHVTPARLAFLKGINGLDLVEIRASLFADATLFDGLFATRDIPAGTFLQTYGRIAGAGPINDAYCVTTPEFVVFDGINTDGSVTLMGKINTVSPFDAIREHARFSNCEVLGDIFNCIMVEIFHEGACVALGVSLTREVKKGEEFLMYYGLLHSMTEGSRTQADMDAVYYHIKSHYGDGPFMRRDALLSHGFPAVHQLIYPKEDLNVHGKGYAHLSSRITKLKNRAPILCPSRGQPSHINPKYIPVNGLRPVFGVPHDPAALGINCSATTARKRNHFPMIKKRRTGS